MNHNTGKGGKGPLWEGIENFTGRRERRREREGTGRRGCFGRLEDQVVGLLEVNHENEIKNIGVFMR